MAIGDIPLTLVGNLTADPELRFTPSGQAVANFTVASTARFLDRQTNEWKDGETLFQRCSVWREPAENVANTLAKGMRVIAQGRLQARSYQTKEGENRYTSELEVDEIGPALRYATAQVTRTPGGGGGGSPQGGQGGYGGGQSRPAQGGGYSGQQGGGGGGWGQVPGSNEPPF